MRSCCAYENALHVSSTESKAPTVVRRAEGANEPAPRCAGPFGRRWYRVALEPLHAGAENGDERSESCGRGTEVKDATLHVPSLDCDRISATGLLDRPPAQGPE
jgi:hypothetical protein